MGPAGLEPATFAILKTTLDELRCVVRVKATS